MSENLVIDNIKNRRAIRKYTDKKIPKEILTELIDCATYAPSSHNRQPWNFVVITKKDEIDALSADIRKWYDSMCKFGKPFSFVKEVKKMVDEMEKRVASEKDLFFYHAPCVVIIHSKNKDEMFMKDCACAAQNMLLAARSIGIGSCWIGFADIVFNKSNRIKKKYYVPSNHKVMATLIFGYPEKFPSQALPRKDCEKIFID